MSEPPAIDLPDASYLAALALLPGAGPARLSALLHGTTAPAAWQSVVRSGVEPEGPITPAVLETWAAAARDIDPAAVLDDLRTAGIGVVDALAPAYPSRLLCDPEPPPVVFFDGSPACLETRCVAVVGTRRCTRYGVDVAHELGARLAAHGVTVVSGLAAGIDAAAHAGALSVLGARPAAVVACGLDLRYPRQNTALWSDVAAAGIVLSEAPLGVRPERWRFPSRNRIIAGLSEVVVVVESHAHGGSLYTAGAAIDRDLPVIAVPGPIRSPASAGTNRLLADGCHPLCRIDDVIELLDLVASPAAPACPATAVPRPEQQQRVLDAIAWQPTTLGDIVVHSGLDVATASEAIFDLVTAGAVVERGRWFERTTRCAGPGP